jgi:FtsH-binding integral membrane protein
MNIELVNFISQTIGFAALVLLAVCVLLGGYILTYEMFKIIGRRLFLPLWIWEMVALTVRVKLTRKPQSHGAYIGLFLGVIEDHEAKHPELRGLFRECCEAAIRKAGEPK